MKKIILSLALLAAVSLPVQAGQVGSGGVKEVRNNGNISGNPSYLITCRSGGNKVVIRKNGKWTDGLGYSFSNSTWNLSLQSFSSKMCS